MNLYRFLAILLLFVSTLKCYSQQFDSAGYIPQLPDKCYSKIDDKLTSTDSRLRKKSHKYLKELQRRESRLKQIFQNVDRADGNNLFSGAGKEYEQFSQQISGEVKAVITAPGQYVPYLDSLGTSLKFLSQFKNVSSKAKEALKSLNSLQYKLQQSQKLEDYLSQRKEQIRGIFSKYTKLPAGFKKQFGKLNKTAYYYSAQLKEFKEGLKDPSKAEQKALNLLNKLPAFQKFMRDNSQLASMFMSGVDPGTQQSLAGLQTRVSTQALVQQQVMAGGRNAGQIIQQNIAQAQGELDKLKDKVMKFGGGSSDVNLPDFKPNIKRPKVFQRD